MIPEDMLLGADETHREQFFDQIDGGEWTIKQSVPDAAAAPSSSSQQQQPPTPIVPSENPIASLKDVVGKEANRKKRYSSLDAEHSARQYDLFVDLLYKMLAFRPTERISPTAALAHPFITEKQ